MATFFIIQFNISLWKGCHTILIFSGHTNGMSPAKGKMKTRWRMSFGAAQPCAKIILSDLFQTNIEKTPYELRKAHKIWNKQPPTFTTDFSSKKRPSPAIFASISHSSNIPSKAIYFIRTEVSLLKRKLSSEYVKSHRLSETGIIWKNCDSEQYKLQWRN